MLTVATLDGERCGTVLLQKRPTIVLQTQPRSSLKCPDLAVGAQPHLSTSVRLAPPRPRPLAVKRGTPIQPVTLSAFFPQPASQASLTGAGLPLFVQTPVDHCPCSETLTWTEEAIDRATHMDAQMQDVQAFARTLVKRLFSSWPICHEVGDC